MHLTTEQINEESQEVFIRWFNELVSKGFLPGIVIGVGKRADVAGQMYVISNGHSTADDVRRVLQGALDAMPAGGIVIMQDLKEVNDKLKKKYGER